MHSTLEDPGSLPEPWLVPSGSTLLRLEQELYAELGPGHPLYGCEVRAMARCEGCDDVLFQVTDRPYRWAVVHLTWSGHREPPSWPRTAALGCPAEPLGRRVDHGCGSP
ncbi:hypothetical protein ACG5V6_05585 [Streptomyces chitinivorans]|uniref:Uncharacterized protein n=1 Tax=Streptomyces chitinivorans TaxID=1257027 RepID=A0ABW7HPI2_9ACTN|nr:hypothetical protein [Streptomyces chitinivorans]MDH2410303.1 hypothetical protein [Streptomyces chitinivorans]